MHRVTIHAWMMDGARSLICLVFSDDGMKKNYILKIIDFQVFRCSSYIVHIMHHTQYPWTRIVAVGGHGLVVKIFSDRYTFYSLVLDRKLAIHFTLCF